MGQWWVLPPHGPYQCGETVGPAEGEGGFVTPQETELRKAVLNPCWSPPAAARETSQWTGSLSAVGSQGQQLDGLFTATSSFAGHRSPRGTFKCKREDTHPGSQKGAHPTRQPKIQDRKHSITQSLKIVCSWWISPSCLLLLLHLKATQYTAAAARGRLRRVEVIFKVIKLSYLFPKYFKMSELKGDGCKEGMACQSCILLTTMETAPSGVSNLTTFQEWPSSPNICWTH